MTSQPDPPRLFVYGTLMPGRLRWPILEPFVEAQRPASVPGALYDSGEGWPVAAFVDGPLTVPGVLVDLDPSRLDSALPLLDDVEDTATDKLRRIVVTTTDGATAWAYHHHRPVEGLPQIEAWHDGFAER
ncbi:MAG: gamma-glutamylcyclotransferase [Actinomycetota bacterium]|nr:gamma-glutamylcyclotransferase [Actinomycetota bacterium]